MLVNTSDSADAIENRAENAIITTIPRIGILSIEMADFAFFLSLTKLLAKYSFFSKDYLISLRSKSYPAQLPPLGCPCALSCLHVTAGAPLEGPLKVILAVSAKAAVLPVYGGLAARLVLLADPLAVDQDAHLD